MSDDDLRYYADRMEVEQERAKRAAHPGAKAVHSRLADAYRQLLSVNAAAPERSNRA